MKINLEFDSEQEKLSAWCAFLGLDLWSALREIDNNCRARMKYDDDVSQEEQKFLEEIRYHCEIARVIEE